ncbi:sensor histidine kinase [Gaoshiqia sp. Z1-71]|uniref:sensor histidine kinase n=1 Tax=Gaoshiqia hydrogeniformans TaxID=3290090 RepID=UPI003BF81C5C
MGRNTIRVVIVLATFSMLGILLIQFFFFKNTVNINEKKFHDSATLALKNVARHLHEYNAKTLGYPNNHDISAAVDQISNNYYVVNVNDVINPGLLEHFLIKEFKNNNIELEFEYAIYDCENNQMVYGISLTEKNDSLNRQNIRSEQSNGCTADEEIFENHYQLKSIKKTSCSLPTCEKYTYYFGVYFPNRSKYYSSQIHTWYVVNGFLLIVILFFGYTIYVIFKQRRLSEVQKNFINNLTHEFKTPIASIDLSAKVLADPRIINHPRRLEEYSKIIGEQTQRLSSQVEKVLQMATIEKKKIQLDLREIKLAEFIEKTIDEFKTSQNGHQYEIEFDTDEKNTTIQADTLHFANVIFNILDNAFKYCDEVPRVVISQITEKNHIKISFADNGLGIPKEYRKKIFGRFFRIPTGDVHNVKGFGLGLDYVRKIIDRHGWKINVSDNSPKGSIFTLSIPV